MRATAAGRCSQVPCACSASPSFSWPRPWAQTIWSGDRHLTTWGLLLFAVGATFLFVAFHLGARRRALQTADGLAQMRGATAALARISPAFAAAGIVLIAAGLPFLLWWLLPASPAWDVFGTPFAAVAATAVGIFLYGALALISGLRMDRGSWPRLPFILYGGASVLLGASTLADLFSEPYVIFTPSAALLIEDSLDRFFGSWGLWALVTGGLPCLGRGDRRRQVPPRWSSRRSVGGRLLPGPGRLGFHRARKHVPVLDGNGHDHSRRVPYAIRIELADL